MRGRVVRTGGGGADEFKADVLLCVACMMSLQ